jgi:UDP-N-acetylmuramoyl-L-alanyl-D-glutamate--2,6-diaminopimelate ligase
VKEIEEGVVPGRPYEIVLDRKVAIWRGIELSRKEDSVIIAGKGHEDYQILGTTKVPFDDREVVREALRAKGWSR